MNILIVAISMLLILFILIITMKIKIEIINMQFSSQKHKYLSSSQKTKETHFNRKYQLKISVYILNKIPILKFVVTPQKIEKLNQKTNFEQKIKEKINEQELFKITETYNIKRDVKEIIKNIKINVENLNLELQLGTENAMLTAFIIPIMSTVISLILAYNQNTKRSRNVKHDFLVQPIYQNKNQLNFQLTGIFTIKMIHIINTICILSKKRRDDVNERTSNRRSYDYSYE